MEGELTNQSVEERREGQSEVAKAAAPLEGSRENSVVCEGLLKPQFSPSAPSDSVLTDSGVSEMTNTESDYSDSLEQDDEDAKTLSDGVQAEETGASLSPSSKRKSEVVGFEDSGDASWFDQDTSDFFIDSNLTHDNGIVEFDPNSEDFTNWESVKSFFEGLIERQNTELDKIASFDYEPEAHDSYATCRSVSDDEAEKRKISFSLFDSDEECLLDTENLVGPFPSSQRFVMHGASPLSTSKVIKYNFEMHDESWGHSSHEPYFDVVTGQRILSTIYEFEVSSDEDTESVKVVDSSWHEVEPVSSEKRDGMSSSNKGQEEKEGGKEEDADENICGKETKQNEEVVMLRGNTCGSDSPSAAYASSGDGGTLDDETLPTHHNTTSATPPQTEGREKVSECVVGEKCVDYVIEGSETKTQALGMMEDKQVDLTSLQSETLSSSREEQIQNEDQESENLVNLVDAAGTPRGPTVGTQDSIITGHTHDGLEVVSPPSEAEAGSGGGGGGGDRERGTGVSEGGTGDGGDEDDTSPLRTHQTLPHIALEDSISPPSEPVFRDDTADPCPKTRADSPLAAGPEGAGGGTQGHEGASSQGKIDSDEGISQLSLRESSREGEDRVISQTISSLTGADRDNNLSVVSPAHHRFADAPVNHSSDMQEEDESQAKNNKRDDEATLTLDPFTCLSPDAAKERKEDEERPAVPDTCTEESPEEPDSCEPPSSVLSSESHITEHKKHSEREPPPRPNRKIDNLNTLESWRPAGFSPFQLTLGADGRDDSNMGVPEHVSPQQDDGWGVSGSSQGHPDMHTTGGDGRELLEEEEGDVRLLKNFISSPDPRNEVEEGDKKENKEQKEKKEEEGSIPSTPALIIVTIPLQQEVSLYTTITTTTTTGRETEANPPPEIEMPSEGVDEDIHSHYQIKPPQIQPLGSSISAGGDSRSDSTTTTTTTVASPQKPKRSSRAELRKPRTNHIDSWKSESDDSCNLREPPARPARRKQANTLRSRKATSTSRGKDEEVKQNKNSIRPETGTAKLESESRLGNDQREEGGKQGSDSKQEKAVETGGNESSDSRLEAGATEPEKGDQGRSDSRLETEKKIRLDDRLDGGEAEAERERGSDSGSGGEVVEGEEEAVEGSGGDTFSTHQEPRGRALPAGNTNSLDDAVARGAAEEPESKQGHDGGITGVVKQNKDLHLNDKHELALVEDQSEAGEEEAMMTEHQGGDATPSRGASPPPLQDAGAALEGREASDEKTEKELSFVPAKGLENYSEDQSQTLDEKAGAKMTVPATGSPEGQVPPPRRRRNVSASRSLHLEDDTADPDTGQTQTAPIAPVRRKRQFSSLPRPPKTRIIPRDVSPSLSTSALALASSTQHQVCNTSLRSVSTLNIPAPEVRESPSFPNHNGAAAGRETRGRTAEVETEVEANSDRSRRLSEGSTQDERKRRTLKRTLKRTGSLREKFYTRIQQKLEKSPRRQADGGPKIKYFSRIFHRKQKLYDMSGPSHYPSEIPDPAPPPEHLSSENTETFATLLSSYFAPDMGDQGKPESETRTKYTTLEHNAVALRGAQGEHTTFPKRTPHQEEHLLATTDNSETTALLQENLDSSRESVKSPDEGNNNEGFVHDEIDRSVQDSPLDGDSDEEMRCQRASDSEKSCSSPVVTTASWQNPEERQDDSCPQPAREDSEELEPLKDTIEDTSQATEETENEETTTQDDRQTSEALEEHPDLDEDCEPQNQDSDRFLNSGKENTTYVRHTVRPSLPPPPPPPPPPPSAEEESHEQEDRKQAVHTWERPSVSLRTWAERQGIKSLTLPPLHLRAPRDPDLEALDFYYDSDSSQERDTPSPGPPVDAEKEGRQGLLHKQKREEDRTQKDRCVEVYPETVRQRQRNTMATNNKVDIKNWSSSNNNNNNETQTSPSKSKKFLPSVKALRNQFEAGKTSNGKTEANGSITSNGTNGQTLSRKSSSSSVASTSQEKASSTTSLHSPSASVESLGSPAVPDEGQENNEPVEPIFNQFRKVDQELRELMSKAHSTSGWDPRPLLKRLYYIPEAPKLQSQGTTYVNIEGYLEKLPSGRKKATFWNAWKRRYFMAKNGILYYYQSAQTDKPSMKMTLMGGKVECMEPNMVGVDDGSRDTKASNMLGIDDGKGHYVVVRCSSRQEAERWRRALETHTVEDFTSQYVQPWPMPTNPKMLRDILIVDIGSASIRAGVLASQATLPQVFIPSVVASGREGRGQVWGMDALAPDVRASSSLTFPIKPTHKITKYSVDLSAVSSLLQKAFADLKVDPKNYHVQLSVPRVLNTNTQAELLRVLFDKFGVRSVNLTHQSILALYAYNATSGIVVDVGERMDIVPVIDGYIVDGGVSRVPYGGYRILDHLRQFLYMRNISLINEVESYIIRQVLESICYCAHHYNTEKARCTKNPENFEKSVSLAEYFSTKDCPYESISLDFGRFQATEGLFNPDAWGLDHPGLHKLVHKAIMECSMDIRKEMSRSIFLAGGVTQIPGLVDRLTTELDNLTPPAIRPKVHASPYRYHAAYIGACVLAESPGFTQSRITQEDWNKHGNSTLRKWSL